MALSMVGKSGFITAAGSGIGRATSLAFAKAGANVVVSDVDVEGGEETVRLIKENGGEAIFVKCDATNEAEVKTLVEQTVQTYGQLDFAHNNAGYSFSQDKIGDTDFESWDKTIKLTLYSVFFGLKHAVNAMKKTGGGAIVNTASTSGIEGVPNMAPYIAAKHGVVGLTKSTALEYGNIGIRVNAVAPGATLTPALEGWAKAMPEQYKAVLKTIPTGEMAAPEDQANAVLFLCSDIAKQVNGVILPVDGGVYAGKLS